MSGNNERVCQCCGLKLERKRYNDRLEDKAIFAARKFCSIECSRARSDAAKAKRIAAAEAEKERIAELQANPESLSPLEHLLRIMRDPNEEPYRRDRAAIAAAKYCHPLATATSGKKDQRQAAAEKASTGRFASAPGPKIIPIR